MDIETLINSDTDVWHKFAGEIVSTHQDIAGVYWFLVRGDDGKFDVDESLVEVEQYSILVKYTCRYFLGWHFSKLRGEHQRPLSVALADIQSQATL